MHVHLALDVSEFDVNLEKQEVIVKSTLPYDDILARIKKTGKEVRHVFIGAFFTYHHNRSDPES